MIQTIYNFTNLLYVVFVTTLYHIPNDCQLHITVHTYKGATHQLLKGMINHNLVITAAAFRTYIPLRKNMTTSIAALYCVAAL